MTRSLAFICIHSCRHTDSGKLFFIATAQVRCAAKAKLHTCARVGFLFVEEYNEQGTSTLYCKSQLCILAPE